MTRTLFAWDTETALIRPGVQAPELVCMSICTQPTNEHPSTWPASLVDRFAAVGELRTHLLVGKDPLIGHNIAFDFGVMIQQDPDVLPLVFDAYNSDRVFDTQIRMQLLDIAGGRFRKEFNGHKWIQHNYHLADLAKRCAGWQLDKDTWRLRYGELRDTPIDQWPEGAQIYPRDDARATLTVFLAQEQHAQYLEDQHRQVKREFWLRMMSNWGLRTNRDGVEKFSNEVAGKLDEMRIELESLGLVRAQKKKGVTEYVRNTKVAARHMLRACAEKNLSVVATDTMEKKVKAGGDFAPSEESLDGVALDADSCERTEDPILKLYADYGVLKSVQSKDVKLLLSGTTFPVHSHFSIVETGRTSSAAPNVQNIRRLPGIRECFVPRDGCVFMQADYPSLELHTLAQACIDLVGYSNLAQALNADMDPHTEMAGRILGITYEECRHRIKAKEHTAVDARQTAKVANFGFPGGLGAAALVGFARATYKVILTEERARELKQQWLSTWPEMRDYFAVISNMCEGGLGNIIQLRSNRQRGGCRYTASCNTFFQGLGADAASTAGWLICQAMYDARIKSVLYGSRLVNFVHDEFIGECPDDQYASDRVKEICRLMIEGANPWIPDCPFKEIEPCLMSFWSKDAKTIIDDTGRVVVWRGNKS